MAHEAFLRELSRASHHVHVRGTSAVVSRHNGEMSIDLSGDMPVVLAVIAAPDMRSWLLKGALSAARLSQSALALDKGLAVEVEGFTPAPDGIYRPDPLPVTIVMAPGRVSAKEDVFADLCDAFETGHVVLVHDATSETLSPALCRFLDRSRADMALSGRILAHCHLGHCRAGDAFANIDMAQFLGDTPLNAVSGPLRQIARLRSLGEIRVLDTGPQSQELGAIAASGWLRTRILHETNRAPEESVDGLEP